MLERVDRQSKGFRFRVYPNLNPKPWSPSRVQGSGFRALGAADFAHRRFEGSGFAHFPGHGGVGETLTVRKTLP